MWSWERERRRQAAEEEAQLGVVTLSGTVTAANLGGERRGLILCAPGGLCWRPREGARVLVLKTAAGENIALPDIHHPLSRSYIYDRPLFLSYPKTLR